MSTPRRWTRCTSGSASTSVIAGSVPANGCWSVASASAIATPALLRRSGLRSQAVGNWLRLHPSTAVSGIFDESIRPWEGTMQSVYSDEFTNLDGHHFGPKIESAPLHPALLALVTPWRRPDHYRRLMRQLPNLSLTGILLRDSGWGRVTSKDGTSRVDYRLSRQDQIGR